MTVQPMEAAYHGFASLVGAALETSGFLSSADLLVRDPAEPVEPDGDATAWAAAVILNLGTAPVRTLVGGGSPTFVVERQVRIELAAVAQDQAALDAKIADGSSAMISFVGAGADLTLGGLVERIAVQGAEIEDLPPLGQKLFLSFVLRIRAGDALGLTPLS
jgi:hypothetical protein